MDDIATKQRQIKKNGEFDEKAQKGRAQDKMRRWADEGSKFSKWIKEDYPEFKHAELDLQFESSEKKGDA